MQWQASLPLKTGTRSNESRHWSLRAKEAKQHRRAGWALMCASVIFHELRGQLGSQAHDDHDFSVVVELTRVGPRLLDSDNLPSSMKAVRDGIADALGVDDGPFGPIEWRYEQRQSKAYLVEVSVTYGLTKSA
jgi:hypothetical protein